MFKKIKKLFRIKRFNSESYWEDRYISGRNSGDGSYGRLAEFKASIINQFVSDYNINTVIEYGCGDGNQLKLSNYKSYIGFDVSKKAVALCNEIFKNDKTKQFNLIKNYNNEKADLTLSLDVIYHLIENDKFNLYMDLLFTSSTKFVIIYSSNIDYTPDSLHVKHRKFSDWIIKMNPEWELIKHIPNAYPISVKERENIDSKSFSDFFIYKLK